MIKRKIAGFLQKTALFLAVSMVLVSFTACTGQAADTDAEIAQTETETDQSSEQEADDMELEKLYMDLLGIYLKEQLNLAEYDADIEALGCIPLDEEQRSDAQKRANFGLKYIYLRNDLHIDRLSEEDRNTLAAGLGKEEGDEYDKALEVVVRTFPICTRPMPYEDEEGRNLHFVYDDSVAAQNGSAMVTMDTILIKIATQSEYDENGEYVDEAKETEKENGLYSISERMESDMEGLLGDLPVRVIIDMIM